MNIRNADKGDAAAIAQIYNQGIKDRIATLEIEPRSAEERTEWLQSRTERHPVLVATDGNRVLGWASLNRFNQRSVYDHVGDVSVYVARADRGKGVGSALLTALEDQARTLGYHKLVLAALAHNSAVARLYARRGFRLVGTYREQGMLDGHWVDVTVMEKILT